MASRWCKQNIAQVFGEHRKGFHLCVFLHQKANLGFEGRLQQALPRILAHRLQEGLPHGIGFDYQVIEITHILVVGHFHGDAQYLLFFAATNCEHTVRRHACQGLREVVVVLELGFLVLKILANLGSNNAFLLDFCAQILAALSAIRKLFCQNIAGHVDCSNWVSKAFLFAQEDTTNFLCRVAGGLLYFDNASERFQSAFLRNRCASTLLGLKRCINIFEQRLVEARNNLRLEFGSKLALLFNTLEYSDSTFIEFAMVFQLMLNVAKLDFVEGTGLIFAVACDKGNCAPFVHKLDGFGDAPFFKVQLLRDDCSKIHKSYRCESRFAWNAR